MYLCLNQLASIDIVEVPKIFLEREDNPEKEGLM